MTPYLELDQCSNSRTHQDLAPTKTHMEVHILSNGIKQPRLRTELKYTAAVPNRIKGNKAGNTILIGANERKH